jgi:serine/threonine protein phosphatase PrpC
VFDGHGGREVAVYCGNHYENILKNTAEAGDKKEWMRKSFLEVDVKLRLPEG